MSNITHLTVNLSRYHSDDENQGNNGNQNQNGNNGNQGQNGNQNQNGDNGNQGQNGNQNQNGDNGNQGQNGQETQEGGGTNGENQNKKEGTTPFIPETRGGSAKTSNTGLLTINDTSSSSDQAISSAFSTVALISFIAFIALIFVGFLLPKILRRIYAKDFIKHDLKESFFSKLSTFSTVFASLSLFLGVVSSAIAYTHIFTVQVAEPEKTLNYSIIGTTTPVYIQDTITIENAVNGLNFYVSTDDSNINGLVNSIYTINSITTPGALTENSFGISFVDPTINPNQFQPLQLKSARTAIELPEINSDGTVTVWYGIRAEDAIEATYTINIEYYADIETDNITPEEMTPEICANLPAGSLDNTFVDENGDEYIITKSPDGNCWMEKVISPSPENPENPTGNVCPTGWHEATQSDLNNLAEFYPEPKPAQITELMTNGGCIADFISSSVHFLQNNTAEVTNMPSDITNIPVANSTASFTLPTTDPVSNSVLNNQHQAFLGWSRRPDTTTPEYPKGQTEPISFSSPSLTLYAIWQAPTTLVFMPNDGKSGKSVKNMPANISTYANNNTATFTIPETEPTQDGYRFRGWHPDRNYDTYLDASAYLHAGNTYTVNNLTENTLHLYAIWQKPSTLEFHANAEDDTVENMPSSVLSYWKAGHITFAIPDNIPTREGYQFIGWGDQHGHVYDDCQPGGVYDYVIDHHVSPVHVYAIWQRNQATLIFEPNAEDNSEITGMPTENLKASIENNSVTFTIPEDQPEPTREGYRFRGWHEQNNNYTDLRSDNYLHAGDSYTVNNLTENTLHLYAIWQKPSTLEFHANAEDDTVENMPSSVLAYWEDANIYFNIPDNVPTRNGYTFVGWKNHDFDNLCQPGGTCRFVNILLPRRDLSGNTKYVDAVWKENNYATLSFEANAGDDTVENMPAESIKAYIENDSVTFTIPETTPTREGYRFRGWGTDNSETLYQPGDSYAIESPSNKQNFTLKAIWQEPVAKAILDSNGLLNFIYDAYTAEEANSDPYKSNYEANLEENATITNIYLVSDNADNLYDVSWLEYGNHQFNSNPNVSKITFDDSFRAFKPKSTKNWFYGLSNLTSISNLSNLNTSEVLDMSSMFTKTPLLSSLELPADFGTEALNMNTMFSEASSLESLTLPSGFGKKATNINYMFYKASSLVSVTLPEGFGTAATDMYSVFAENTNLEHIYVPKDTDWATKGITVTSSDDMFSNATNLPNFNSDRLDVSAAHIGYKNGIWGYFKPSDDSQPKAILDEDGLLNFVYDTYSIEQINNDKDGYKTAYEAKYATIATIYEVPDEEANATSAQDIPWWNSRDNLQKVNFEGSFFYFKPSSTSYWFVDLLHLTEITNLENLNTENTINMDYMFNQASALESLTLPAGFGKNARYMNVMFTGASHLRSLTFQNVDNPNPDENFGNKAEQMDNIFIATNSLESLVLPIGFGRYVENMDDMFSDTYLETLEIKSSDNPEDNFGVNATTMNEMFDNSNLETLTLPAGFGSKTTEMKHMFQYSSIKTLSLPAGFGSLTTDMTFMFRNSELETLTLPAGFGSLEVNMHGMFSGANKLTSLTLPENFGQNATNMISMFKGTLSLTSLDLPTGFGSGEKLISTNHMFSNSSVNHLVLPEGFGRKAINMNYMFSGSEIKALIFTEDEDNPANNFGYEAKHMEQMFYSSKIRTLTFPSGFGRVMEDAKEMFRDAQYLTSIEFPASFGSEFFSNPEYNEEIDYMFYGDSNLRHIYVPAGTNWCNTEQEADCKGWEMFKGATNLPNYTPGDTFPFNTGNGIVYCDNPQSAVRAHIGLSYYTCSDSSGITLATNVPFYGYFEDVANKPVPTAKAILSANNGDTLLNFVYDGYTDQQILDNEDGYRTLYEQQYGAISAVYNVMSGYSSANYRPWHDVRESVKAVNFDESFSSTRSLIFKPNYWFKGFTNLKTVTGLENINFGITGVSAKEMFAQTPSLTTITIPEKFGKYIKDATNMFQDSGIETITFNNSEIMTANTTLNGMFYNAQNLKVIYTPENTSWCTWNTTPYIGSCPSSADMFTGTYLFEHRDHSLLSNSEFRQTQAIYAHTGTRRIYDLGSINTYDIEGWFTPIPANGQTNPLGVTASSNNINLPLTIAIIYTTVSVTGAAAAFALDKHHRNKQSSITNRF